MKDSTGLCLRKEKHEAIEQILEIAGSGIVVRGRRVRASACGADYSAAVVDSRRIAPAFGLQNGDLLYIYSNP